MKLKFLGAAKTVTGSFFIVQTDQVTLAVDCGLFQGSSEIKERNYGDFPISPSSLDFLILTHAHIDHSGLIPKLCKQGFKGRIYCSQATGELVSILLPDSAHIQESEVERKNRKSKRAGNTLLMPIYTGQDALNCLKQICTINMDETIQPAAGIEIRLRDAGHILGSCIVEMWVTEAGHKTKLVFSGDLGNTDQPLIKDPTVIESADYVIVESTYGDRLHEPSGDRSQQLKEVIDYTMRKGGNLIIPAFAVERTQDIIYDLVKLNNRGLLDARIEIYIDSPLAIATTEIFIKHQELYDDETRSFIARCINPLDLANLKYSRTQEDSMRLNEIKEHTIIISASGMCEAGRIKHHLKHNLWRPESTVLFVGYQAQGTLGRRILEGEKNVTIHGEHITVKADIRSLEFYSAHADQAGLTSWLQGFVKPPQAVFVVHGEEKAQNTLAEYIGNNMHTIAYIPDWQSEYDLTPGVEVEETGGFGIDVDKAEMAEQMWQDLRNKLNCRFDEKWKNARYEEIIKDVKQLAASLD